jgi:uncharacterized RDD family membrane protein YckC
MADTEALWQSIPTDPAPGIRYANAAERVWATVIDDIVLAIVAGIPYAAIGAGKPTASATLQAVGALLVVVAAEIVFGAVAMRWNGQTVGGRVVGIRIVQRSDGSPIVWWQALIRPIGIFITWVFWFISLLTVVLGREKRTPADVLAGTVVIKRRKPTTG